MSTVTTVEKLATRILLRTSLLIVAVALLTTGMDGAVAQTEPRGLVINSPMQIVTIGDKPALFWAHIVICKNGPARGFGIVEMQTGETVELRPIYAKLHSHRRLDVPAAMIVFLPELDGPAQPSDFVVGVVRLDPNNPGYLVWDVSGATIQNDLSNGRLQFDAVGTVAPTTRRCGKADFGQLPLHAEIAAPRQVVFPFSGGDPLEFEAKLRIRRDNSVRGFINVPLSVRGSRYETFFGAVLPHPHHGVQFFVIGAFAVPGDPPSTDDMLRASTTETTSTPDCLIWDLQNGTSGGLPNASSFDAQTTFRIWRSPR